MTAREWATVIGAAAVFVACSSEPRDPTTGVVERTWNVVGEVTAAEFVEGYAHEPSQYALVWGGPGFDFESTVGPLTLTMADGTTLEVAARTPGGNACRVLLTPQDRIDLTGVPEPTDAMVDAQFGGGQGCWIVAEVAADGRTVEWFQVTTGHGSGDVAVGNAVAVDEKGILTDQGWRFPYSEDDSARVCERGITLAELIAAGEYPEVRFDPATKRVTSLTCVSRM